MVQLCVTLTGSRSGRMRGAVTLGLGIFEVATQYDSPEYA